MPDTPTTLWDADEPATRPDNKFHAGNGADGKHYWLTPPELYEALSAEYGPFDFDPCPYPLPDGFDGLTAEWGQASYVNPPFGSIIHEGRKKGPTAWVRKALAEHAKGKKVVLVYPIDKWILMLLAAGAQVSNLGDVKWLATEDGLPGKGTGRHIACFVLDPARAAVDAHLPGSGGLDVRHRANRVPTGGGDMTEPTRPTAPRPEPPIDIEPQEGEEFVQWLGRAMEALNPSDYATAALNRDRPYNGQPHTDEGERGRTLVEGLTMRDIKDCFVIGAFRATGKGLDEYPANVYGIDWSDIDPMAVCQNMLCAIEERMGIFPNLPESLRAFTDD